MIAEPPEVILLDLDDTIIDFESSAQPCWKIVCDAGAAEVDGLDPTALLQAADRTRTWFWSDPERHRRGRADLLAATSAILNQALRELGCERPGLATTLAHTYRQQRWQAIQLLPGAVETLEALRWRGHRLGLVTNGTGEDQRAKIERFELAPFFEHILIEGEFGHGKPDPRVYLEILSRLGTQPQQAWFVGDNLEWDIAAPHRLGMYTVWIDAAGNGPPGGTEVQPNRIVRSLVELLAE